jgi:ribosomal protein S27AE
MEADEKEISRASARLRDTFGTLILTNRRILFEHGSGVLTSRRYSVLNLSLLAVKQVTVERGLLKAKVVLFVQGEGYSGLPRVEIEIPSADRWCSMISAQVSMRHRELEEDKRRSRIQYVIDFSFLKDQMERGGISLESIKCPSCGASVQMPSQGNMFKCAYCGSLIQSQDVYERMKGFLQSL